MLVLLIKFIFTFFWSTFLVFGVLREELSWLAFLDFSFYISFFWYTQKNDLIISPDPPIIFQFLCTTSIFKPQICRINIIKILFFLNSVSVLSSCFVPILFVFSMLHSQLEINFILFTLYYFAFLSIPIVCLYYLNLIYTNNNSN